MQQIPEFDIDPITNSQGFDDYFLSLIKPWTDIDLERFYIYAPNKPALTRLASLSGIGFQTIRARYTDGDWATKRKEYWIAQKEYINTGTIEKLGDLVVEQNTDLLWDHFSAYKMVRETAFLRLKMYHDDVKKCEQRVAEGKDPPERLAKILKSESARDLHFLAQSLDIAVKGERQAMGIEFWQNKDAAYKALQDDHIIINKEDYERDVQVIEAGLED